MALPRGVMGLSIVCDCVNLFNCLISLTLVSVVYTVESLSLVLFPIYISICIY